MKDRQKEIDFTNRGIQRGLLRDLRLPSTGRVSEGVMKAVLNAIDEKCGARPAWRIALQELCNISGFSRSSVKRAIRQLEAWYIVNVTPEIERGSQRWSSYAICWRRIYAIVRTGEPLDDACERSTVNPAPVQSGPPPGSDWTAEGSSLNPAPVHCGPPPGSEWTSYESAQQQHKNSSSPTATQAPMWEEAEAEVASELGDLTTFEIAKGRVSPQWILGCVAHYRAGRGVYGPGALHHRLRNAHPDVAPEKNWQPPFPPSARVQDALAALDDCRALAPPELAEAEFWEVFGRQLQKLELGDTLAEVQFRDSFRRSHDR